MRPSAIPGRFTRPKPQRTNPFNIQSIMFGPNLRVKVTQPGICWEWQAREHTFYSPARVRRLTVLGTDSRGDESDQRNVGKVQQMCNLFELLHGGPATGEQNEELVRSFHGQPCFCKEQLKES